jgi:hypothetical protein
MAGTDFGAHPSSPNPMAAIPPNRTNVRRFMGAMISNRFCRFYRFYGFYRFYEFDGFDRFEPVYLSPASMTMSESTSATDA